jgi:hypothetical protein
MLTFQQIILRLQQYWDAQGCALLQPYDMEVGAGTSHTATFLRALGPEPTLEFLDQQGRPRLARFEAGGGILTVQVALNLEQGVDPLHRLEGDGRDFVCFFAFADVARDICQFEELAPSM